MDQRNESPTLQRFIDAEAWEPPCCPTCGHNPDDDAQFDRDMQLLAWWDRKKRWVNSRFTPGGLRQRWTFEDAIV